MKSKSTFSSPGDAVQRLVLSFKVNTYSIFVGFSFQLASLCIYFAIRFSRATSSLNFLFNFVCRPIRCGLRSYYEILNSLYIQDFLETIFQSAGWDHVGFLNFRSLACNKIIL